MERANPILLFAGLLALAALFGFPALFTDGLYIAKHEGDAIHFLDILLRMDAGQVPHVDFLTPIGSFAFWPVVAFMGPETGPGLAFAYAQVSVFLVLIPAIVWIGMTRLSTAQALGFGLTIAALTMAYVHGQAEPSLSVSMHYNRWAWTLVFLVLAIAVLPAEEIKSSTIDGLIIGTSFALLALIKVTYVVGFALPVLVALLARRQWFALLTAVLSAMAFVAVYTLFVGIDYWFTYFRDLVVVSTSGVRSSPSNPLSGVIGAPAFLGGNLLLLVSVILLRQAKAMNAGLVLLFTVPGCFYVTFQNYGNDPQWLYLLPILLLASRPTLEIRNGFGWDLRRALTTAAVVAMALAAPSFFNLAYSPFRHLAVDGEDYVSLIQDEGARGDVFAPAVRLYAVRQIQDVTRSGELFDAYAENLPEPAEDFELFGEVLPRCETADGYIGYFDKFAVELTAAGFAGENILQADVFSTIHWLYGDFPPLKGGAPWSYGTEAGLRAADYLLVALCPLSEKARSRLVESVTQHEEITLTEVLRNEFFILFRVTKP